MVSIKVAELPAQPEAPPDVAGVEGPGDAPDEASARLGVGVPGALAPAGQQGHHERPAPAVLLDLELAVAEADPRLLPAAHRHVHGGIVDDHVVDVDRAGVDAAPDLLGPVLLAEHRR